MLPFSFPSSVISMILLALFLQFKWIKEEQIADTADFLLSHMIVFFVPACVGILNYWDVLLDQLLPFILIAGLTTPIVYGVTAWTVTALVKWGKRHDS